MNHCDEHLERAKVFTLHKNLQAFRSFEYIDKQIRIHEKPMDNLYIHEAIRFDWMGFIRLVHSVWQSIDAAKQ